MQKIDNLVIKIELKNIQGADCLELTIDDKTLENFKTNFGFKLEQEKTPKQKLEVVFAFLSKKLASIKRHFFASPFQMMLQAVSFNDAQVSNKSTNKKQEKRRLDNLCYHVKMGGTEKVWLSFSQTQFSVYYLVYFESRSEQQLCRVLFSELVDSTKHVKNPPGISLSEKDFPKPLLDAFPQQKNQKYTLTNAIFGKGVRKLENMATSLASFRNYIYYHIQAQKCYLHSRILNTISDIDNNRQRAIIEPIAKDKEKQQRAIFS